MAVGSGPPLPPVPRPLMSTVVHASVVRRREPLRVSPAASTHALRPAPSRCRARGGSRIGTPTVGRCLGHVADGSRNGIPRHGSRVPRSTPAISSGIPASFRHAARRLRPSRCHTSEWRLSSLRWTARWSTRWPEFTTPRTTRRGGEASTIAAGRRPVGSWRGGTRGLPTTVLFAQGVKQLGRSSGTGETQKPRGTLPRGFCCAWVS